MKYIPTCCCCCSTSDAQWTKDEERSAKSTFLAPSRKTKYYYEYLGMYFLKLHFCLISAPNKNSAGRHSNQVSIFFTIDVINQKEECLSRIFLHLGRLESQDFAHQGILELIVPLFYSSSKGDHIPYQLAFFTRKVGYPLDDPQNSETRQPEVILKHFLA